MKKFLSLFLVLLMTISIFASCGADGGDKSVGTLAETGEATEENIPVNIRIGGLKGPTSMGMVKLLENAENGLTANTYDFTLAGSADELTPKFLKGDLDILAVPANLGAVLYNNSDGAVQMLAINTLGVIYIVEKGGNTVNSIADLKGKTIYSLGKGSTPEYALNYILEGNGLDPEKDVTVEWKTESTEVVSLMATEEHAIAMLPQPFVTVAQSQFSDLRIALDMTEEWEKLGSDSMFLTGALIVRREFADEHPDALKKFLEECSVSTDYTNENIAEAAKLIEKYDIIKATVAETALPYCNVVFITGEDMKSSTQGYFNVLFEQNEASLGGKMPGDDFYVIYE